MAMWLMYFHRPGGVALRLNGSSREYCAVIAASLKNVTDKLRSYGVAHGELNACPGPALERSDRPTGTYFSGSIPAKQVADQALREKIWNLSCEYCGLTPAI